MVSIAAAAGNTTKGNTHRAFCAPVPHGSEVKAFVTLLHQRGRMSVTKIKALFGELFSAPINEVTILQSQHTA